MPFLDWVNKNQAKQAAAAVPYHLLKFEAAYGDGSDNLLIQGDNLLALKALVPFYAGRVKCVYADPPFNTEQAFEHYDDKLEHSQWLSLMYPRLVVTRQLLSNDGSIFLHIDDNEIGYLIAISDEVFGRENRVAIATFKQGSATGHKAINPGMVNTTNFLVVYAKNKPHWKPTRLYTNRDRDTRYNQFLVNPEADYSHWDLIPLSKAFSGYNGGKKIATLRKELGNEEYEEQLNRFVINNAARVIRPARPDYESVSEVARQAINQSKANPDELVLLRRDSYSDMFFKGGERWIFYKDKLKEIDGEFVAGEPLTTLWDDVLSNNLHNEGGVSFPKGKKPEALVKRILELSTSHNDVVLDSFLGSGTTAAVAHKMGRRYIGIEMKAQANTHCIPRLRSVISGEQGGISKHVNWRGGGGFRFYTLGEPVFQPDGAIHPQVRFPALAAYIWHMETAQPATQEFSSPLLGRHEGTAYILLYNGILGDRRPQGGNVLTHAVLQRLKADHPHDGPLLIYGETSRIGAERLKAEGITFKQIPYDVRAG
jgi:adenine-specific DNA-methyltransferase